VSDPQDEEQPLAKLKKIRKPDELVSLSIRVHPDARRKLRIRAAEEDRNIEEIVRALLYPELGLKHLPAILEPATS
jgi:plasmid stability protein